VGRIAVIWMVAGAFAAGACLSWLVFRGPGERVNSQGSSAASGGENASAVPPDVSHLEPAQAALTLGNWTYDHQKWAEAIDHSQRTIALGLDNADVRTDLGNAFRFSGQPRKALEQYRRAQTQNSQHEHSLFNMGTLYAEALNDPPRAAETWREYLRRFPNSDHAPGVRQLLGEEKNSATTGERAQLMEWMQKQETAK
jgi:tetratricopeptide (TPR) repeat protein